MAGNHPQEWTKAPPRQVPNTASRPRRLCEGRAQAVRPICTDGVDRVSAGRRYGREKYAVQLATSPASARGLPCHMLPDGMTVRVDEMTAYEPDALVYCGTKLSASDIEVPAPIIVVEVLSPLTPSHRCLGQARRLFPPAKRRPVSHRRSEQAVGPSSCARERGHDPHAHRDAGLDRTRPAGIGGGAGDLLNLPETASQAGYVSSVRSRLRYPTRCWRREILRGPLTSKCLVGAK